MKRAAIAVGLLVVLGACHAGDEQTSSDASALTGELWVYLEDAWQRPPPQSGLIGFVPARVLRFDADGTMSLISCALLRTERETFISPGDGLAFYFGKWHAAKGGFVVDYVKTSETTHASSTGLPFERKLSGPSFPTAAAVWCSTGLASSARTHRPWRATTSSGMRRGGSMPGRSTSS